MSQNLEVILKRQYGDQYGFGDNIDSNLLIMKNMDQKMLDGLDASNIKSLVNHFGNLDRQTRKIGAQGFEKWSDDLAIKILQRLSGWAT